MPPKNDGNDDDTLNEQTTPEAKLGSVKNNNNKVRNDDIPDDEESCLSVATEDLDYDHYAVNIPHGLPPQNDDDDTMNELYTTELL